MFSNDGIFYSNKTRTHVRFLLIKKFKKKLLFFSKHGRLFYELRETLIYQWFDENKKREQPSNITGW